ncbi:MAG: hypothetical protein FAZ92_00961 [Accumulibacter sp.]|uniref:hypothetical protein n=1 Tax=Accumulibacter sp. TaxID=2053492 RepID=UPI00121D2A33|nr:hypothetical protein [Accumulibacter sp.]QKS30294.1 MAG: hypothetical protein HT579_16035 [Candidatus Accumulibacter similis]TLD46727.1 MAG: hypothetical protein FAZ92_00961 [Accumulibacter sp.]
MGILDWFKNRPAQFDADRVSEELIRSAVDKAITLTNPRLAVLPGCHRRLAPAAEKAIEFLRALVSEMPASRPLSAANWSADPALRAFFVAPADIAAVLARSDNLRTLFDKYIDLDEACVVLGMSFTEQRVFGMALQGDLVQRDVAQTSVSFSDHRAHICGRDESRLRRAVGAQAFEYLLAQALAEIGEERVERQELEANRSLLRARLRLLRQQGPGLGSLYGNSPPAASSEQARLEAELLDNEKQLAAIGGNESLLEMELDSLREVLENPQRYLRTETRHLRLNPMNIVVEGESSEAVVDLDVHVAELSGAAPVRRAVIVARVGREQMTQAPTMNLADAARYL